jgi:hypothetical protein
MHRPAAARAPAGARKLACAPFTIYKIWLHALMFRAKWEMRFAHHGDSTCLVSPRKRTDVVMFFAGPHSCTFKIRRVHANAWSRPSEALVAVGWKNIVPQAKSVATALQLLWKSLDVRHEFDSADAWDTSFGDQDGEMVVWEMQCLGGRFQKIDYSFTNHESTYSLINMYYLTHTHTHRHVHTHGHVHTGMSDSSESSSDSSGDGSDSSDDNNRLEGVSDDDKQLEGHSEQQVESLKHIPFRETTRCKLDLDTENSTPKCSGVHSNTRCVNV